MVARDKRITYSYVAFMVLLIFTVAVGVAHAQKAIKIGVIGPMKFNVGEEHWVAASLAAEEINLAGGIKIRDKLHKIELIKEDSNEILSVTDAVSAMERLITGKKADFIVGGYRTEAVLAMQEVIADHKKVWINAYIGSPVPATRLVKDYNKYKYYFRLAALNPYYCNQIYFNSVAMVAAKVKEELGFEKPRVAILVEKAIYTEPTVEAAKTKFPEMGLEIVGIWRPSFTAADLTGELTAIKNSNAHIIFNMIAGPLGAPFSKQWGELKIPAAPVGVNMLSWSDRHWETTGGLCNYEATFNYFGQANITPTTIAFIKKMKARYGYTPTNSGVLYEAVYILKEALERAGTTDSEAVVAAVEKTDYLGPSGRIMFTPKDHPQWPHDVMFGPKYVSGCVTQWRDGKILVVWPDGKPLLGDKSWVGLKYPGTVDYRLPPWMVDYWRKEKK